MGLECFIATGQALLVVAFALVVLGVSIVWALGPVVIVSRDPAWVGFLLVLLIALIVVVRAFAISVGAFGTVIRTSPIVVLIALLLAEPVKTAHMIDDELSRSLVC